MVQISLKKEGKSETPPSSEQFLPFAFFARSFNWFVVVFCVIVLAVGYWFLIQPKYMLVVGNDAILAEAQAYERKISYLKELNEIKNLYRSVSEADKEKIDDVLSARDNIDSLTLTLQQQIGYVARLNGAQAADLKATPLDNSEGKFIDLAERGQANVPINTKIIVVSFTLTDVDYASLKRIIGRLEQSLRLLDVTKLDYNPLTRQAQIELYAYHLAQ